MFPLSVHRVIKYAGAMDKLSRQIQRRLGMQGDQRTCVYKHSLNSTGDTGLFYSFVNMRYLPLSH